MIYRVSALMEAVDGRGLSRCSLGELSGKIQAADELQGHLIGLRLTSRQMNDSLIAG